MRELSLFIIGMPRSGTKLLRCLLNNHNEIFIPENETLFIPYFLKKYSGKKLNAQEIDVVIEELQKTLFFFYYLKSKSFNFDNLRADQISIKEFLNLFFNELGAQGNKKAKIIGDKSPNYIFHLDQLIQFYPAARFIHIVRDPRDHALSMRKAWNKNIYRAAYRWKNAMDKVNTVTSHKEAQILEVQYEDLISSPSETLKQVCAFIGVDFYDKMLNLDSSVENLGDAKAARIFSNNFQKYLSELSGKEIKKIEQLTFRYLKSYGYFVSEDITPVEKVGALQEALWKLDDIIHLVQFNFKTHGVKRGIEKLLKANRFS